MKTILAYGDSLTYRRDAATGGPRHAYEDRWPTRARGGPRRQGAGDRRGAGRPHDGVRRLVRRCRPQRRAHPADAARQPQAARPRHHHARHQRPQGRTSTARRSRPRSASGGWSQIIRGHPCGMGEPAPQVIIVSPPLICRHRPCRHAWPISAAARRTEQPAVRRPTTARRATSWAAGFFDAATVAKADPLDGVHLDAANTRAIGEGLVPVVKSMLGLCW